MKRALKKALLLFLVFSLTIICCGFGNTAELLPNFEQEVPIEVQRTMQQQIPALSAYTEFEKNFEAVPETSALKKLYAGEYIDGDKLVILLTDSTPTDVKSYHKLADNSSNVTFSTVQYSLAQLEECENIALQLSKNYSLISYGVDTKQNRFFITVPDSDYDKILKDELVIRSQNMLLIENAGNSVAVPCATNLYGGNKISKANGDYMTICICGTYNGSPAVLTAGHFNEGSPNYYYNSSLIGKVAYQRCNTNSSDTSANSLGDFAIIKLNSSFNTTSFVKGSSGNIHITGTYSSVPVGTTIYKYGAKTGYSWGKVSRTEVTAVYPKDSFSSYRVRGLYQSSMTNGTSDQNAVDEGDSGGCVYMKDGSSYKIHGNVSGVLKPSVDYLPITTMYSSPIYYAQDVGFSPKTN